MIRLTDLLSPDNGLFQHKKRQQRGILKFIMKSLVDFDWNIGQDQQEMQTFQLFS